METKPISPRFSPVYLWGIVLVALVSIVAVALLPTANNTVIPLASIAITAIVTLARLEPPPDHRTAENSQSVAKE